MTLTPGVRLGSFEIVSALGAGGMGEVYKARDTRLERLVAVKVLPAELSRDEQLRQRFMREARAISSLAHPHICALYDVGSEDGVDYLVMEYLEGETLADRLARGPLPADALLRFAMQIGEALDRAHRQGIVHRDLKPANVMLTRSGVKLLDFGLAKLRAAAEPGSTPDASRVVTELLSRRPTDRETPLTVQGTVLGTLQYMSPEQLEGKEADPRSDIFAFGAVLYEMASGRRPFEGKSPASLIAAILTSQPPPLSTVAPLAPSSLDRVVRTCLAKDPEERWQSAHDIVAELRFIAEAPEAPVAATPRGRGRREAVAWALAAVFAALAAVLAFRSSRPEAAPLPYRFHLQPPPQHVFNSIDVPPALSPDGRTLAFSTIDRESASGKATLWVRPLESLEARQVEGTAEVYDAFWSADGSWLAFGNADVNKLMKAEVRGGPPQPLADLSDGRGGTWNAENVILFAPSTTSPILRISSSGGTPVAVTALDASRKEVGHWRPHFLPDGKRFLYLAKSSDPALSATRVGSLDGGEAPVVLALDVPASYAKEGYLLFARDGALMAQRFDERTLRVSGDAFSVARGVQYVPTWASAAFSAAGGNLVYDAGGPVKRRLDWLERSGKVVGTLGDTGEVRGAPRISVDGKWAAVAQLDPTNRGLDVWIYDVVRGVGSRLTSDVDQETDPVLSPDASEVCFSSNRNGVGDLFRKATGGGEERLVLKSARWKEPNDWSRDGRYLLYRESAGATRDDLWALSLGGTGSPMPVPVAVTAFAEFGGRFSPDGRLVTYTSDESGRVEVYAQPFPPTGLKWRVSADGGWGAFWKGDGSELYYHSRGRKLMAVAVTSRTGAPFAPGPARELFPSPGSWGTDVTPDGQRFLANLPAEEGAPKPMTIVLGWAGALGR